MTNYLKHAAVFKRLQLIGGGKTETHAAAQRRISEKWLMPLCLIAMLWMGVSRVGAWTNVYLASTIDGSWNDQARTFTKVNDNYFTLTLNSSEISNKKIYFRIKISDNSKQFGPWDGNDYTMYSGQTYGAKEIYNGCLAVDNSSGIYESITITAQWISDSQWDITVKGNISGVDADAYYFVSPELTGSKLLDAFKFSKSRVRRGGAKTDNQLTFHLQDFLLDANHKNLSNISYFIVRGDGLVISSTTDNYYLGTESGYSTDDQFQGNNTKWQVMDNCSTSDVRPFKLNRGTGKSYTWFLYTGTNKVEILINSQYCGWGVLDSNGYYLVGNFTSATASIDIDPSSSTGRKLMTKYWYKNGKEYTTEQSDADSIVYRVTVPRPSNGWGELYLAVFGKTDIDEWKNSNDKEIEQSWLKAIRPQVQWDYTRGEGYYKHEGLDATALRGGLYSVNQSKIEYYNGLATDQPQQALNPDVSNDDDLKDATSYTFQMNVTTSTYTITFNKELFIMGPAVDNGNDDTNYSNTASGWYNEYPTTQTAHAYKLVYNQLDGSYTYRGESGTLDSTEQLIRMTQGKKFDFVFNKDFTKTIFMEDGVVPVDMSGTTDNNKEANAYSASKPNYDTQYVNFLSESTTATATHNNNVNDCVFNLPSGEYYIRLYIKPDPTNADKSTVYYIVKPRKVNFYHPQASNAENGKTYRSFCDYHAVIIPDGVTAYAITNYQPETDKGSQIGTATLTKLSTSYGLEEKTVYDGNTSKNVNVLPAKTPVLLTHTTSDNSELTQPFDLEYYAEPRFTATLSGNMLKDQVSRAHIEKTEGSNANYLFGYRRIASGDAKPTIGFFVPGTGDCSINTAYLQVPSSNGAKTAFVLDFDNAVDGIEDVEATWQAAEQEAAMPVYDLNGRRVGREALPKGIYVRNGKKMIIR